MHKINTEIFSSQNPVVFPITKVNYQRYMTRAKIKINNLTFPDNDIHPEFIVQAFVKLGTMVQRGGMKNGQAVFDMSEITLTDGNGAKVAEFESGALDWIQVGAVLSEELSGYPYGYLWMLITFKADNQEFHILNSDFKALNELLPLWHRQGITVEDPLDVIKEWKKYHEDYNQFRENFSQKYSDLRVNTCYPAVIKGENPVWGED